MTTRMMITTTPRRRKNVIERDHGSLPRQLETTKQATPRTSNKRNGFGFCDCIATTARHTAHSHHANGCNDRDGRRVMRSFLERAATPTPPGQAAERQDHDGDDHDRKCRIASPRSAVSAG